MPVSAALKPAPALALDPQEVHVWHADRAVLALGNVHLSSILDEEERARAARFYKPRDRTEFTAAHAFARILAARYLARPTTNVVFDKAANGKPFVVTNSGEPALQFNASRTKGAALFAFALGRQLGADIEAIRPRAHFQQLCAKALTARECEWVQCASGSEEREVRFHRLWVRKEAVLKASGDGLRIAPLSVEVLDETAQISGKADPKWRLTDIACDPGYAAAIATNGEPFPRLTIRSCEELLPPYIA